VLSGYENGVFFDIRDIFTKVGGICISRMKAVWYLSVLSVCTLNKDIVTACTCSSISSSSSSSSISIFSFFSGNLNIKPLKKEKIESEYSQTETKKC
jgi:hypothetical protein